MRKGNIGYWMAPHTCWVNAKFDIAVVQVDVIVSPTRGNTQFGNKGDRGHKRGFKALFGCGQQPRVQELVISSPLRWIWGSRLGQARASYTS